MADLTPAHTRCTASDPRQAKANRATRAAAKTSAARPSSRPSTDPAASNRSHSQPTEQMAATLASIENHCAATFRTSQRRYPYANEMSRLSIGRLLKFRADSGLIPG